MIYFNKKDNKLVKYNVIYDKEELKKLREEIINNCSKITKYDYIGVETPSSSYNFEFRNFEQKKIGIKDNREYNMLDEIIYRFRYDKYEYPQLVEIIDGLLRDSANSIDELFNYSREKEFSFYEISLELLNVINSDLINERDKLEKLKQLEELIKLQSLNIYQKSIYPYYDKIFTMIKLEEITSIEIDKFKNICDFFECSKSFEEVYNRNVELFYKEQIREGIKKLELKKQ